MSLGLSNNSESRASNGSDLLILLALILSGACAGQDDQPGRNQWSGTQEGRREGESPLLELKLYQPDHAFEERTPIPLVLEFINKSDEWLEWIVFRPSQGMAEGIISRGREPSVSVSDLTDVNITPCPLHVGPIPPPKVETEIIRVPPKGGKKVTFDLLDAPSACDYLPPGRYSVSVEYSRHSSSEEVLKSLKATSNTITVDVIAPKPGGKE